MAGGGTPAQEGGQAWGSGGGTRRAPTFAEESEQFLPIPIRTIYTSRHTSGAFGESEGTMGQHQILGRRGLHVVLCAAAAAAVAPPDARGSTFEWTNDVSGFYSDPLNWTLTSGATAAPRSEERRVG